jgi:hypothetical protein
VYGGTWSNVATRSLTFEISEDKPRNRLVDVRLYKKSLRKNLPGAQKEAFRCVPHNGRPQ